MQQDPAASPLSIVRGACGHDCPDTCTWLVETADVMRRNFMATPIIRSRAAHCVRK